jgi:hypothetical protein
MRHYAVVSGAFFSLLALVQLTRLLLRWPVQVDGVSIPRWASVLAIAITGSLAIWAFRSKDAGTAGPGSS